MARMECDPGEIYRELVLKSGAPSRCPDSLAALLATLKVMGIPIATGLAATLLFRGFSYWLPMAPGILIARRETRT